MEKPLISVIIPVYRDNARLTRCLEAIDNQTLASSQYEIIVVNNAPDSPLPTFEMNNLTVAEESKKGSYAARNKGIDIAAGSILAFTDSDCIPDKSWLETALKQFESNQEIFRIAGNVKLFFDRDPLSLADCYEVIFGFKQERFTRVGKAVTANMFSRKRVFEEIGLFKEDLQSGGDMEWGVRAQKAGYAIDYNAACIVEHPSRSELTELLKKSRRVAEGILEKRPAKSYIVSFVHLLFKLIPPIYELGYIWSKGKELSTVQKIKVFLLRYRIRIVRELEILRLIRQN